MEERPNVDIVLNNPWDWNAIKSDSADSILIARKTFDGPPKHPDFRTYKCDPPNQNILRSGLIPYQTTKRTKGIGSLLRRVKRKLF